MFKWSRDEVIEYLKTKAENIIFKVKSVRNTRTLQQNKYMHAIFWICGEIIYNISWDSDFTAEGTKQYFKQRFLWTRKEWQDGEIYVFTPSTADLDTKEIKEFIDKNKDHDFPAKPICRIRAQKRANEETNHIS